MGTLAGVAGAGPSYCKSDIELSRAKWQCAMEKAVIIHALDFSCLCMASRSVWLKPRHVESQEKDRIGENISPSCEDPSLLVACEV